MSYFVNAAPVDDNNSIEYKKKNRNQTLKRAPRPKLPNISFAEDNDVEGLADFKPLAPPKIKEPHQNSKMNESNSDYVEEGFTNEDLYSNARYEVGYGDVVVNEENDVGRNAIKNESYDDNYFDC